MAIEKYAQSSFIRHRYVICALVSSGLSLVYAMRVNLSVSIISMAGSQNKNTSDVVNNGTCSTSASVSGTPGEFEWDENLRSIVLGAFFYGYISTQILGGIMAEKLSIKWVLGYGIFFTSVLTIVSHWVVRWNVYAFIVLRILEGITEGVTVPSVYCLMSRWAPINERSTMTTLSVIGMNIGTIITMPITAALCKSSLGWPASFYLPGAVGVIWSLVWYLCATSQPENHPWISDGERKYIIDNRGMSYSRKRKIPWLKILTSRPVWMFALARLCNSLTFYMFLTEMPTFIDSVFHISIDQNGILNGLFYVANVVGCFLSGVVSDILIKHNVLSRTNVRKLFECSALLSAGCLLVAVTFIGCDWTFVIVILCVASFLSALVGGGDSALALDLAPNLAGSVMGFGNTVGNLAAIIATNLVAATANSENVYAGWNSAFYYTAAANFAGAAMFALLGSAEEQPWSNPVDDEIPILSR